LAKLSAQVFSSLVGVGVVLTQTKHPAETAAAVQQTCIMLLELMVLPILAAVAAVVPLSLQTFPVETLAQEL
jgi:hypothetical protein